MFKSKRPWAIKTYVSHRCITWGLSFYEVIHLRFQILATDLSLPKKATISQTIPKNKKTMIGRIPPNLDALIEAKIEPADRIKNNKPKIFSIVLCDSR